MTELPTSFGKYFLTEKLATGGMAEIYLAKIVGPGGFEKPLVIKQIHPKLTGQRHFVDLFVAEAKTLVSLAHGNIVPVYELGVVDDTYFIAMEYIDGPTLYRLTEAISRRDGVMAPAIAAWIVARILEGLDYAHRKGEGVIHRDLSPRNVMLSRDGEVKLVDFGIAVTLGAADESAEAQSAPTGSFPYMSPEQVRREPLTGQTDLFSVGVLFWEMLVGRRLFARPDADATLAAVTGADIERPSASNPDVPARLDEVVMRALERDRGTRWSNAGEMLGALQKYLYGLDETPGPGDVAALVAKYCPPETRRLPTHVESPPRETPEGTAAIGGTAVIPRDAAGPSTAVIARDVPAGPSTAVIPREAAARGKGRARTETFATHVDLEHMLAHGEARATPLFPIQAITDEPAPPRSRPVKETVETNPPAPRTRPVKETVETNPPAPPPTSEARTAAGAIEAQPRGRRTSEDIPAQSPDAEAPEAEAPDPRASMRLRAQRSDESRSDDDREIPRPERPPLPVPGRLPPSGALLVFAAIGAILLGLGALYVFKRGRAGVLAPDAAPKYDAPFWLLDDAPSADAIPEAIDAEPVDAPVDAPIDAVPIDAAPIDAVPLQARDAEVKRPDGPAVIDGPPAAVGKGTVKVGADPWGKIFVDGVEVGITPKEFTLPVGHHVIEVVYTGDDPPKRKRFDIDVHAGDNEPPLQADFH